MWYMVDLFCFCWINDIRRTKEYNTQLLSHREYIWRIIIKKLNMQTRTAYLSCCYRRTTFAHICCIVSRLEHLSAVIFWVVYRLWTNRCIWENRSLKRPLLSAWLPFPAFKDWQKQTESIWNVKYKFIGNLLNKKAL